MIWNKCKGPKHIKPVSGTLFRWVESQEQIATLGYVDTMAEQALLEEMLEEVKPSYPELDPSLHYLLKTPFRYPPLKWGSRFGSIDEPSIFYGASSIETTLAESAYYRFVFWYSMQGDPVKNSIRSEHTLFSAAYNANRGIKLHQSPFNEYTMLLSHPTNYRPSQLLGRAMREAEVEAFEYVSARDPKQGLCIGLFFPSAFTQKQPKESSQWLCELSAKEVACKQVGQTEVHYFHIESFLIEGELLLPAQ